MLVNAEIKAYFIGNEQNVQKMQHQRQRISPRFLVLEARRRLDRLEPLTALEFQAALSALKLTGIKDCAERIMSDAQKFCLTELLEDL